MRELQTWMYGVITAPEPPSAEEVLKRLTDAERIALYRDMYGQRMVEALTNDYPALAAYLGEHNFGHLVDAYTRAYPSSSYTFNRFGDHFPAFIAEGDHEFEHRQFLADLARLELAMTEVFDEAETPLLGAEKIASITPDSTLRLIAALRLHAFAYPVNDFFQAFRNEEVLVMPQPRPAWSVVHRRDYSVMRMDVDERAYRFLTMLGEGVTLGDACEALEPTQDELFGWFRDWSAAGIFGDFD